MNHFRHDAIVGLAGIGYGPGSDTESRALHVAHLWHEQIAPEVIITGAYPSLLRERPAQTYAELMYQRLRDEGVPDEAIISETNAITTIENMLYTKPLLGDRKDLALVTSPSHMPRALSIARYVLGNRYTVTGYASAASNERRQGLQERVGDAITWISFRGTTAGDHEAIAANHARIFPGEGAGRIFSPLQVIHNSLHALVSLTCSS